MRRITANPWIVSLTAASFLFYQYMQITIFNVLKPDLQIAFNTSHEALSFVSALYFYGTALCLIPAGILLDYFSTRKIILLTMSISLVGLTIFTCANTVVAGGLGRLLVGVSGGTFCFLASMRIASRWFPANRLGFVSGVIVALPMLGGMVSQAPFAMLVEALDWKSAMYLNICLGVLITGFIYLIVHDCPADQIAECLAQRKHSRQLGFISSLKAILSKIQNWYCGLFLMLLNMPVFIFGAFLGVVFLQEAYSLSRVHASFVSAWLFVGMLIGSPTFGYLSDKFKIRKTLMLIGVLICIFPTMFALNGYDLTLLNLVIIFGFMGFGSGAQVLVFPTVIETNPAALTTSALSLTSAILMGGTAIFQSLIVYSTLGLWLLPMAIALSGVFLLLIKVPHRSRIAK